MRRRIATATFLLISALAAPAFAQQDSQKHIQTEADKGIKTQNSGASGYVGEQDKSGAVAGPNANSSAAVQAPSAQNSGVGIAGAPGNKNGPPANATSGTATQNLSVQEQDTSGVKGLPGSKSGPPAKR